MPSIAKSKVVQWPCPRSSSSRKVHFETGEKLTDRYHVETRKWPLSNREYHLKSLFEQTGGFIFKEVLCSPVLQGRYLSQGPTELVEDLKPSVY